MFFSVITKNLNCEILTKNLVILKVGMGLMMKYYRGLREGVIHNAPYDFDCNDT